MFSKNNPVKYMVVSEDKEAELGLLHIPIYIVDYLEYVRKINRVIVHTQVERFYIPGTIKYWTNGLNGIGYVFRIVDRRNSVNVNNITKIDTDFRYAYFDDPVLERSKRCTLSEEGFKKLLEEFPDLI